MPKDAREKPEIKVTDKRIFTAEGDIREEFRNDIQPAAEKPPEPKPAEDRRASPAGTPPPETGERRRTMADKATNPESPFTNFIEPLIAQGYMSLGMLRNPYQPQAKIDVGAARQMIDILTLLKEKTAGNLTADEEDFLETHLGELRLAYVQRTKSL
ncbi:MAG TPA: DUF1844 domain-containing protein [Thermoanaerobaculia bacterium]|nr:DUF1844 domain-containing protein [Thermoanaerobaculia bacterium]